MSENDVPLDDAADAEHAIQQPCSEKEKKQRRKKECVCSDTETCKGLTAAFSILDDKRKRFVRIPHFSHTKPNLIRQAQLRYLLPGHLLHEETPSRYIAAHHFDPRIVLATKGKSSVPRTLTRQEATRLGLNECNLQQNCMFDEELLRKVYIVVPNYPLEQSKKDVTDLLNQILDQSGDEDVDQVSLSKENIVDATVRVKAVQDETEVAYNEILNIEEPGEDMMEDVRMRSFSEQQQDPAALRCTNTSPTGVPGEAEPSLTINEKVKSDPAADNENDDLCFGNLPDDLCIVSISSMDDDTRPCPLSKAKSEACLSTPETLSTIKEKQHDVDQQQSPIMLRAQSEPIIRTRGYDRPRGILKRHSTDGAIKRKSSVNFGTVDIREYPIMPGDNPGGLSGPPVTIDWKHQGQKSAKIDEYEESRPKRRSQTEFSMPATVRQSMLRDSGYSLTSIQRSTKKANIIRNRRRSTAGLSHMYALSVTKERWTRGLCNATVKRTKKQKEREYIRESLTLARHLERESSQSSLTDGGISMDDEASNSTAPGKRECTQASLSAGQTLEKESSQSSLTERGMSFDDESDLTTLTAPPQTSEAGTSDDEGSLSKVSKVYCCLKP